MTQEIIDDKKAQENLFNFGIANSPLVKQSKSELESATFSNEPEMHTYGTLPYFENRKAIVAHLPQELSYFDYDLIPEEEKKDLIRASEAMLLFEMKAGFPLSELSEQILANYPDLEKEGRVVSVFGLSGAGKSVALEAMREKYGDSTIVIDSDSSRYNLLSKIVSDAEQANAKPQEQIKSSKVIHNRISLPFYILLDHVTSELKNRGYFVVRASTEPYPKADVSYYIEHPDDIDPVSLLNSEQKDIKAAALELHQRTSKRVEGKDNYDWDNPELITRFEDMRAVSVQVPPVVHERFLYNVGNKLRDEKYQFHILHNPRAGTVDEAKKAISEQLDDSN